MRLPNAKNEALIVALVGCLILAAPPPCLNAADRKPKRRVALEQREPVHTFSFPPGEGIIVLPVTVSDEQYLFALDTGSSHHVFDQKLRRLLGASVEAATMATGGDAVSVQLYRAPIAFVGDLKLRRNRPVACLDLTMIRRVTGLDVFGVLGIPVLEERLVHVDFDRGMLSILHDDHQKQGLGEALSIHFNRLGMPMTEVALPGGDLVPLLIDTGCSSTGSLGNDLFDDLSYERQLSFTSTALYETFGGTIRRTTGRLSRLAVGPFQHRDLVFSRDRGSKLGTGYLRRYRVTFDLKNKRLFLIKGAKFREPDRQDMSGLHILREDGETIVHLVDNGTPGQVAGIRSGDRILRILDKPASAYSMAEIRRLLMSEDGREVMMIIRRDGEEVGVTIRLRAPRPE